MHSGNSIEVDYRIRRPDKESAFLDGAFRNLSRSSHQFSPIVDRERELEWMCDRLLCKFKPNILLIGESGVGKTALVEGLAAYAKCSNDLKVKNLQFIEFSVGQLIAGTSYRGDFEKRVIELLKFLMDDNQTVLFIDEAHALAMTGDVHGGGVDALNLLKPFLTTGQVRCILASTPDEAKHLTLDRAFIRRFAVLNLAPLSREAMEKAIRIKGEYLQRAHNFGINERVYEFVREKYIQQNLSLDATLDFLDEVIASISRKDNFDIEEVMNIVFARSEETRSVLNGI